MQDIFASNLSNINFLCKLIMRERGGGVEERRDSHLARQGPMERRIRGVCVKMVKPLKQFKCLDLF